MTPTPSTGQEPEIVREAREMLSGDDRLALTSHALPNDRWAQDIIDVYEAGLQAALTRPDGGGGADREAVADAIREFTKRRSILVDGDRLALADAILALLVSPKVEGDALEALRRIARSLGGVVVREQPHERTMTCEEFARQALASLAREGNSPAQSLPSRMAQEPPSPAWLHMESAPCDGSVIDLWLDSGMRIADVHWGVADDDGDDYGHEGWLTSSDGYAIGEDEQPLGWMPLPEPPDASDGAERVGEDQNPNEPEHPQAPPGYVVEAAKNVVDCWGVGGRLDITTFGNFVEELRQALADVPISDASYETVTVGDCRAAAAFLEKLGSET